MAWNMTARSTSFRSFNSGGARATVTSMLTSTLFNSMNGNTFAGEARQMLEHFEPYGITAAIISKNADGIAEAVMNHIGGARGHGIASVVGDRRYRPLGLKEGETAQYDDIGQMTLLRRTGTYVLSLDGQGGSTQSSGGDSSGGGSSGSSGSSDSSQQQQRMVSLRHVVKSKQPRTPMSSVTGGSGGGGSSQTSQTSTSQSQDFKHEGEQVNTEVRCTAQQIQIFDGTTVVAVYDRQSQKWTFTAGSEIDVNAPTVKINASTTCVVTSPKVLLGSDKAMTPVKLCDDTCATKVFAI